LHELFNEFDKEIDIYGFKFQVKSINLFKDGFDGQQITFNIHNKGFPFNSNGDRGNLLINLNLVRQNNFDDLLKKHFR
jgi:DnaJ-class molecular chaperone